MTDNVTRTATVFVRHSMDCPDRERGTDWKKCGCRKSLLLYDGATKVQRKISAKTRSWEKAEAKAREWLEQFDPVKVELRRLQAEREAERGKAVKIEQAVAGYIADMKFRRLSESTVNRARCLFGDVNDKGAVLRSRKLFEWLDKQTPRPVFISEITPQHLTEWRSTWNYGSDLTSAIGWDAVKNFFRFCEGQGWLTRNPAASIKRPKVERGNRTATFSDGQYEKILNTAKGDQRLETFLELLRWSAMALADAVDFDMKSLDDDRTLRYTRKKTGTLATVKLPERLVVLLRTVPLENGNTSEKPFRRKGITLDSNIHEWRKALQDLFSKAGIKKVKTDVGERTAHPHMLRDTCAVWYLRHGMTLHGVSKILGHSNPTITGRHYLPFVKELENAHLTENDAILEAAKSQRSTTSKIKQIA
jgi:integrase